MMPLALNQVDKGNPAHQGDIAKRLPPIVWPSGLNTGPVITNTSPLARSAYRRVSCSILDQAPEFCVGFCGTMFAN